MRLLFKIAFRNLFRHKGKNLAIGCVIMTGVFFMILGMGTIAGMEQGLHKNVIKGLWGDVTVMTAERKEDQLTNSFEAIGVIEKYEKIQKTISDQDYVDRFLFQIFGSAAMLDISMGRDDNDQPGMISLWGVRFEKYQQMYGDNYIIVEGEDLNPGERGILINTKQRERIFNLYDIWIVPENHPVVKENLTDEALVVYDQLSTRSDLVLMGMSGGITATDVRVPVKGIFKFKHLNELFLENLVDIETSRETMGYISGEDMKTDLSKANRDLLAAADENPDALFSDNAMFETSAIGEKAYNYEVMLKQDDKKKKVANNDSGIYSIAQVNLKPNIELNEGVRRLNQAFRDADLDHYVRAVSWKDSMPVVKNLIDTIRTGLMILVGIIYFAGVLMITNTLSMAAVERTAEIGTMRTVGAQKGLIANMFVVETSLISFLFGGLGILSGMGAIVVLGAANITSKNPNLLVFFGGDAFCPILDINGILSGIVQLIIITILAMIYPVFVARRIHPIDAIKRN